MTHIRVMLVGKVREGYLREGISEYIKRIRPHARVEFVEIKDEPLRDSASSKEIESATEVEGYRVLAALREGEYLIALDSRGRMFTSVEFARWLQERGIRGESRLAFVIGGPNGLSRVVTDKAGLVLSLGPMTFLHQFVPLLLLEQIYRAFKIIAGEPYHR
ncbi:MAG: 23S rRNA (pseudouridine(1915)-N(3))-methyltransferase RlmH [Firmicutes bacterium]|nr:23S rRNA (pseudouridine(1915)-N(3))-methyltransferase RlmH [Candidatus Fermentithermobacillaceae bacterium]